jgi:hypothetical protein
MLSSFPVQSTNPCCVCSCSNDQFRVYSNGCWSGWRNGCETAVPAVRVSSSRAMARALVSCSPGKRWGQLGGEISRDWKPEGLTIRLSVAAPPVLMRRVFTQPANSLPPDRDYPHVGILTKPIDLLQAPGCDRSCDPPPARRYNAPFRAQH